MGRLIWRWRDDVRLCDNRRHAGKDAGYVGRGGYHEVRINGRRYDTHCVVWLIHYGKWPILLVDHKNGNKADFRIDNLREATPEQSNFNRKVQSNSMLGLKGVSTQPRCNGRYFSRIRIGKKTYFLGDFDSPGKAHDAYLTKAAELHGEFANLEREVRIV